jgi:hypothetical protein
MQLNYLIIAQNLWSPCNLLILLGVEFKFKIIWPPRNGRNQGGNGEWLIYSGVAQETRHVQVSINNRLLKEWRLSIISRCSLSRTLGITIKVTLCDFASFSKPLSWNRPCPTWRSHSTIIGLVLTSKVGGNGVIRVGVHQVWKKSTEAAGYLVLIISVLIVWFQCHQLFLTSLKTWTSFAKGKVTKRIMYPSDSSLHCAPCVGFTRHVIIWQGF